MAREQTPRVRKRKKAIMMMHMWFKLNSKLLSSYYFKHIHKVPCYDSQFTGYKWIRQVMEAKTGLRCIRAFRMEPHVLQRLCDVLETNHGLKAGREMSILEKVGIFLYTLALGISNRDVCERFQRSGETVSRTIHEVLEAITGRSRGFTGLARELLKPRDPTFSEIPNQILENEKYRFFEGCIGCIDGTHIDATIPAKQQLPYRGRKGTCTFNVMAACDLDMYFTFISAGWEGSAHDARVFDHALRTKGFNFPHPPPGKYYLVDKGYPDKQGYMVPYSKVKYHQSQFERVAPKNAKEGFNRVHSGIRSHIERDFGVLKKRWKILKVIPSYKVETQVDIILSCFALHNFCLMHKEHDDYFDILQANPRAYERLVNPGDREEGDDASIGGMSSLRDEIALKLWNSRSFS